MKISGIICEYNPLHNGHLYHLSQVREGGADGIVAVMSGNFVQRGDAAILDKFTRARLAIQAGVDLVLELPVPYALAPAENFAMGGVALLTALGNVDEISFGSESGDIQLLAQAAEACNICKTEYADVMDDFLRSGYSYPEVLSQMVSQLYDEETAAVLRQPNNTLAIAYLNAMEELGSPLHPVTIRRRGAGHNSQQPTENTASATYIRQFFAEGGDCRRMMPSYSWHALREADAEGHIGSMEYLERLILYKLRTTDPDEMHNIAEIGQGLEYRLYKAKRAASLSELLRTIQTKRYPMARLRRICCICCWTSAQKICKSCRLMAAFWHLMIWAARFSGNPRACAPFHSLTRWQSWQKPAQMPDAVRHWNPSLRISISCPERKSARANPTSAATSHRCAAGQLAGMPSRRRRDNTS